MCGVSGRDIFPDEEIHSNATNFPVVSAIYTIKLENDIPSLYGFIRYQHVGNSSPKTTKQLMDHNKSTDSNESYTEIKMPGLWNNKKCHHLRNDIRQYIDQITVNKYIGSDINTFYTEDS